ncbi:hypothetical protein [Ralstonia syzygii]|uniref:hypothetical protein n=1 Tax=Ralstonia syzygii TaxID=28097 RepID=UPI0018D1C384|nr:hypothetical protein [Ralstonia syzygii]
MSSALSGLSRGASSASSSQWASVRNSFHLPDPDDSRLTRAMNVLGTLYKNSPTFRELANKVRDEGGVSIQTGWSSGIAATDLTNRIIHVSPDTLSNAGNGEGPSLVSALVFELNNLSRADEANAVYGLSQYGAFDSTSYARELERIEYAGGQSSGQIFQEARRALESFGEADHPERWFLQENPQGGSLQPMYTSFEDNLNYQREIGHTASYEADFQGVFNNQW